MSRTRTAPARTGSLLPGEENGSFPPGGEAGSVVRGKEAGSIAPGGGAGSVVRGEGAGSFLLGGEVERPATLDVAALRAGWQQHRADVVFDCAVNGPQHHTFEGALLREVVGAARPAFDPRRRKERARFLLAVAGRDGHHAVLAWAEVDADFGDAPVLLATRMDGEDLGPAGSHLVVPSDRCGARYISGITGIWVTACRLPGEAF
ncbi:molybdopterin-dependent oxidoreductase [Streptomyces sp. NPDC000410]|uniref:molybdopterin-dependent oxidoreductase n=1 Tax=Streptomyces sp. NPDC000410 TaxID=3154254 RepID=UPI00331D5C07